jgi:hypothetical protein
MAALTSQSTSGSSTRNKTVIKSPILKPIPIIFVRFRIIFKKIKKRRLQDLNLRGETPTDFKSVALTARPNRHMLINEHICEMKQQDVVKE